MARRKREGRGLTDKVLWLEGVEGEGENCLCEGEPADL